MTESRTRPTPAQLRAHRQALANRRPRLHLALDLTIWLLFVWMAAFGSLEPLALIGALLAAVAVQWLFPLPNRAGIYQVHLLSLVWLILRFIWDMARAGLHVVWLIIANPPRHDAILRIQVRTSVPEYLALLVAMTTLVPGTVVVEVKAKERVLYLHCLDVEGQGGLEALRANTLAQEARILRAVAPRELQREVGVSRGRG
ncbi:Na+/H+ antiporter subunit E [Scrofimicrobium sp. R131]|uniref:Na+/H+ antiporter subunit E n=1 Tax=Scrofimicrobium appendicitidis TaxID=3079930 RepID=A0AAU7V6T8_9ACTO